MNRFSPFLLPLLLFVLASQTHAQASRQITNIDRRVETMNRQSREFERDNMGRESKRSKEDAAKRTRQIRAEIEEDLKALQAAYNEIVLALQDGALKPGFAAETAATISKRSARLKANLALPTAAEDPTPKEPAEVPEPERAALKALGRSVYEFITNPIFEGTAALDVRESTRASRDLDAVLLISNALASR